MAEYRHMNEGLSFDTTSHLIQSAQYPVLCDMLYLNTGLLMKSFPSVVIVERIISVALAVHHLKHSLKTEVLFCYECFCGVVVL